MSFRVVGRQHLSDCTCRTKWSDCVTEDFWLIVDPYGSHDETIEQAHTGRRGKDGPGHPQSDTPT